MIAVLVLIAFGMTALVVGALLGNIGLAVGGAAVFAGTLGYTWGQASLLVDLLIARRFET